MPEPIYPPSQKTPGMPGDECEDCFGEIPPHGQAREQEAEGTIGLPMGLHLTGRRKKKGD